MQHILIGYDKVDGTAQIEISVPAERMDQVRKLLALYPDDPDALDPYELLPQDARRIATLAAARIDEHAYDFFLQAFDAS